MDQFKRTKLLFETNEYETITNKKILLVGVGGVGGSALESLVRFGFENITIIDKDTVDITNLNRQIITNLDNVGQSKVEVAKQRALSINPSINITTINDFLSKEKMKILETNYDYIIDACDTITTKIELIKFGINNNIKTITCMGTGKRLDPSKIEITTINKTSYDPVAKVIRKLLRDNLIKDNKLTCIWSSEQPIKTKDNTVIASNPLVPNTAGIYCVSAILKDIRK